MKKIFLLALISLPFVGFCSFDYDYDGVTVRVDRVRRFLWSSFGKVQGSASSSDTFYPSSEDSLYGYFFANTFAIGVRARNNITSVTVPGSPGFVPGSSLNQTVTNSVYCTTNGVGCNASLLIFPRFGSLFSSVAALVRNGYSGPGFKDVYTSFDSPFTYYCINVDFPTLVSDVLSSTNTLYRSLLLSHLNSIQSNVQSIALDLGGLQYSVDHGNNILSNIDQSVSSVLPSLYDTTNILSSIDLSSSVLVSNTSDLVSNTSSLLSGVDLLHDDWTVANIDVFLGDDTQAWIDFLSLAVSGGLISQSDADSYSSVLRSTDPSRSKSYSIPDSRRRFYVKRQIKNTVVEAQKLRGKYQTLRNALSSNNDFTSDIAFVFRNFGNMSGITELVNYGDLTRSWQDQLRQDLQDWKHSDERGILNVRDDIRNNFSYRDPRSGTNDLPFTSFLTNFVTHVITNSIVQSSVTISSNIVEQAETTRKLFEDKLFDPNSDGVNVRIKWPLRYESTSEVNVHDAALDDLLHNIMSYTTTMSNLLEGAIISFSNNATNKIDFSPLTDLLTNLTVAVSNNSSYLLLDHYADYITNNYYSSSVASFERDFPTVYSNLCEYGLSPNGDGFFWSLFGSSLLYQSGLVGQLLEDMATVRRFADDHIEGGFSGGVTSLIQQMPSSTDLADRVNQASNEVLRIEAAANTFYSSFSILTNSSVSAFSPFRGVFSSVPDDLVFFKTGNEQYITIPVSQGGNAWLVIRLCFSFSLVAVNVILFPKFVLMVIVLLSKLSKRFVKFVPTDR